MTTIFCKREADGSLTELGRSDDPGIDPVLEVPGYAAAVRRKENVNFTDEKLPDGTYVSPALMEQLAQSQVAEAEKPAPREKSARKKGDGDA